MDISIIIVSWQVSDLLKKCLETVFNSNGNLNFEVIVVDNASKDDSVTMVKENFSTEIASGKLKLIASHQNLGFAKANNLGVKSATGDYILYLNPDTEIQSDTLEKALTFIKNNPECGILGPKMLYPDGSAQSSVRRFPTFWPVFLMLIKAPKVFKRLKAIDHYLAVDFDYSRLQEVDQVMGAFMLMPKEVVEKVKGFDERYFIWFEEVDLCLTVKKAGYKIVYNPELVIVHHGGKSFAQQTLINNQKIFFTSAFKYFTKNGLRP
jgi:GT2 family glycosyltransferase